MTTNAPAPTREKDDSVEVVEDLLDLWNIQSEVLRGYGRALGDDPPKHATYVFLRFEPEGRERIKDLFDPNELRVTSAGDWSRDETSVNVGFTYAGLKLLLETLEITDPRGTPAQGASPSTQLPRPSPEEVLQSVGAAFDELKETMAARAAGLGDVGASAPADWHFSDGETTGFGEVHAVVMFFGHDKDDIDRNVAKLMLRCPNIARAHVESGRELLDGREHFGYVDGISQPAITGMPGSLAGYGTVDARGRWRKIRAGEIVLGYTDEEGPFAGSPFLRNGSFFVLRKLEQDVESFHAYLEHAAENPAVHEAMLGGRPEEGEEVDTRKAKEWLAARIMGRWFDGEPLLGTGDRNDFRYAGDNTGFGCPFGAHIRRVNPRDMVGRISDRSERHRLARRTVMYTEPGPSGPVDSDSTRPQRDARSFGDRIRNQDGTIDAVDKSRKRGMLFGCFSASIGRQFEVVQSGWLNGGDSAPGRLFTLRDPIAGANHAETGDFIIPARPLVVLENIKRFTTTRGGAYFFVPSVPVFRRLVGGTGEASQSLATIRSFLEKFLDRLVAPAGRAFDTFNALELSRVLAVPPSAGLRRLFGLKGAEKEAEVEKHVLFLMAPVLPKKREDLEACLARPQLLDDAFREVTYRPDGLVITPLPRSIHHARFAVVSNLHEFPAEGPVDRAQPNKVALYNGDDPYLFFGVWFDGPREELIAGLAKQSNKLPFRYCLGGSDATSERALTEFVKNHEIPVTFAYRGYSATAESIRKALTMRSAFVKLIARLSEAQASGTSDPIRDFFDKEV